MSGNILIFGGTSGIGAATARLFANNNHRIFICGRNIDKGETLGYEIQKLGGLAEFIYCDVACSDSIKSVFDEFHRLALPLNAVYTSAGFLGKPFSILDLPLDEITNSYKVNFLGALLINKFSLRIMSAQRYGYIVNTSSVSAKFNPSSYILYGALKNAVESITKSVAKEAAKYNVKVNCVAPGTIDTQMLSLLTDAEKKATLEKVPLGHMGLPEDVAQLVYWLCSGNADYLTGQVIAVDGGRSANI